MISARALRAAGIAPAQADAFAEPLKAAAALHGIDTPERVAAWLAQCAHESAGFTRLTENLNYTHPERLRAVFGKRVAGREAELVRNPRALAEAVYGGRLGNGPEGCGDGAAFIGRGALQLTGRDNYARAANALGRPYLTRPDLVALPSDAALTAAWYWSQAGCNQMADAGRFDSITRAINGPAMLHAAERERLFRRFLAALS